jgi:antitoxin (DNA-binding transcriptional repressor) of toxin-antitoxin stability system
MRLLLLEKAGKLPKVSNSMEFRLMTAIGVQEASAYLPQLLDRAMQGEQIIITREDKRGVMLVPAASPRVEAADLQRLIDAFKAYSLRQGRTLGGLTFRDMINEGRHL